MRNHGGGPRGEPAGRRASAAGRPGTERRSSIEPVVGIAWAAALVTLLVRLPFVARRMWDHDSVQFALGVLDFDLAAHHPHPPGYPLYLGLLKALHAFGVPPLAGMVALSLLAATAGAAAFTLVAARLAVERRAPSPAVAPPAAALLAGALYAFNPLLWFYAELPLVYAVEGGLTAVLAWAALRMGDGLRPFLLACALFALSGGVRPSTLVLLFPLFLYGLYRAWRDGGFLTLPRIALGAGVGMACILAWLVPLLAAVGGLEAYRAISGEHFTALLPVTSVLYGAGWPALAHNLEVLVKWALQGLVPAALMVLVAWGWALATGHSRQIVHGLERLWRHSDWLLVWALPPVLFFALFHVTKAGYILVHLVPLMSAAVLLVLPVVGRLDRFGRRRALALGLVASLAGAGLFLFGADRRPDQSRGWAVVRHEHNARAIDAYERDLDALLAVLDRFPPGETFLASVELSGQGGAGADGFLYPYHRHLQWYAPAYSLALLVPEEGFALVTPGDRRDFVREDHEVEVPVGVDHLVLVLAAPGLGDRLPLPPAEVVLSNSTFRVLSLPLRDSLQVGDALRLEIAPVPVRAPDAPADRSGSHATATPLVPRP